jgi:chromosome segregation ATPase
MAEAGDLRRKTTQLDNDVQEIWSKLDQVTGTQTAHSARFDRVESQLSSITVIVRRHDTRFMELGRDLDAIKMQQTLQADQLARQSEKLAHHDVRLENITTHLGTIDACLGTIDARLGTVDARLDTLTNQVGSLLQLFGLDPGPDSDQPAS